MTRAQFSRETEYGAKAYIARKLLAAGFITEREYRKLCLRFERSSRPLIGGYIPANCPK
jgi:hypothetical protein